MNLGLPLPSEELNEALALLMGTSTLDRMTSRWSALVAELGLGGGGGEDNGDAIRVVCESWDGRMKTLHEMVLGSAIVCTHRLRDSRLMSGSDRERRGHPT